jgi:hypothetical protein
MIRGFEATISPKPFPRRFGGLLPTIGLTIE